MTCPFSFRAVVLLLLFTFSSVNTFSQCFQIETILVDACDDSGDEGFNEMVRFKIGGSAVNISGMNVNWPSNSWQGLVQNATTNSKVATLNAQITALGGCGRLIQPTAGAIPANKEVILITSPNFSLTANAFGALTQDVYIIFQNNTTITAGHFGNYNAASGIRTLSISFGSCNDSVSYDRSLLVDAAGNPGAANGATVNFTSSGNASYSNLGCVAPIDVFSVEAGTTSGTACPGTTLPLSGSSLGYSSLVWSAPSGTFSDATILNPTYTLSLSASGSIVLTLTATNSCGNTISDTVTITVIAGTIPDFPPNLSICAGSVVPTLNPTSPNGVSGNWSPAVINNTVSGNYTFTPSSSSCSANFVTAVTIVPQVIPDFPATYTICSGGIAPVLNLTSPNGVSGTWAPSVIDNTINGPYTFTPTSGQCATGFTTNVTVTSSNIVPDFSATITLCSGSVAPLLNVTSPNGISGTWSPPTIDNTASGSYVFTPSAGQCATNFTASVTVTSSNIVPNFAAALTLCSGNAAPLLNNTSPNGIVGVWSPPTIDNTSSGSYTFTPNAGQCATNFTTSVTVTNSTIVPNFATTLSLCSGTAAPALNSTSPNGIVGIWSPSTIDNTVNGNYTFTPNAGQCAIPVVLTVTITPSSITPVFAPLSPICSGDSILPLPTTSTNGINGTWSPALDNTATKLYTFSPNAGQCATTTTSTLVVTPKITPDFITSMSFCAGAAVPTLNLTSPNGIVGIWSPPTISNMVSDVYTFLPTAGQCANSVALSVTISNNQTISKEYALCVDSLGNALFPIQIDAGLSPLEYTFTWTNAGNPLAITDYFYITSDVDIYQIQATNIVTGCITTIDVNVFGNPPATAIAYVNDDFSDNQQIVVEVTGGLDNFLYQMDYGPFQESNIFPGAQGGDHIICVKDTSGCNYFELQVTTLNFPKFFTPNDDGYHDFWNVEGMLSYQRGSILIFDRYGKLLKQLSPYGEGWTGKYNGNLLPSDDYWFVVSYQSRSGESRTFKSHFALKR
ncbi:MAG: T9SS type B sorting domain-containing protein [Flavobacterium sp.]|nr:T9SS type B sorting domain-containing protein [Flavobacterium sp.]